MLVHSRCTCVRELKCMGVCMFAALSWWQVGALFSVDVEMCEGC